MYGPPIDLPRLSAEVVRRRRYHRNLEGLDRFFWSEFEASRKVITVGSFRSRRIFWLAPLAVAAGIVACSSGDKPAPGGGAATVTQPPPQGCNASNPEEGCPCATEGADAECGAVHQMVDSKVVCSIGRTVCASGTWGACKGERIITKSLSDIHFTGYGEAGACADPCTPGCNTTTDTPSGIALPTGLTSDAGAGITITPTPPPPNTCTGLTISPSSSPATDILVTSTSTLATKMFTSDLVPAGCNPSAPSALWYTDKFDVAQMDPNVPGKLTVVVPIAGPVNVGASLGSFTATVPAKIVVAVQENGTVNPPPSGALFSQFPAELPADADDTKLEIVYPYTGTVLPLGLAAPLLQWRNTSQPATGGVVVTLQYPATGAPIFSISQLVSESMTAPVPLRTAQPRYPFPQAQWLAFEQTVHRNRATLGDTGRILVRRRVGTTTYKAKSVDIRVAPGQLKGKVYYNSYGTALVNNYSGAKQSTGGAFPSGGFGAATLVIPPGGTAPVVAAGFNGGSGCFVCHSASADGATLITSNSTFVAQKYTFPGTPANGGIAYPAAAKLIFSGINPTSTRVLSSSGTDQGDTTSRLFDINGTAVSGNNVPAGLKAGYPTFSPDGTKVAFNFRGGSASPLSAAIGDGTTLSMMTFDGNKTFSGFRNLVTPSTGPSVWPAFLPTSENGVVYQVETRTTPDGGYGYTRHDCECSTYAGATGELWWVTTGASPVAARLNKANGYDAAGTGGTLPVDPTKGHAGVGGTMGPAGAGFYEQRYNYEPTVLAQTIGGYSWVIFTSRRAYGNVATINPYASDPRYDDISIDPTPKKLWVSAISTGAAGGSDPSAPAFYLPGQELIAGNSRAVFALEACHPPVSGVATPANLCDSDLDCCNAPATAACVLDPPPLGSPPVKHCVAATAGTCRAVGASCLVTSNCCNAVSGGVCAGGACTDPPAFYNDQTWTRDYKSACLPGFVTRWGLFDWQSRTPGDSKIKFSAQTSTDGVTWSPATPVLFGTASGADIVSPSWGTSGVTVSSALGTPKGSPSEKQLRITMSFLATSDRGRAPTLVNWRQSIECIPSE